MCSRKVKLKESLNKLSYAIPLDFVFPSIKYGPVRNSNEKDDNDDENADNYNNVIPSYLRSSDIIISYTDYQLSSILVIMLCNK